MAKIYTARWVLPIASPRIEDGAVAIDGSRIVAVGTRATVVRQFPDSAFEDFGSAVILPGLINTHSHLELTVMRGFLEAEEHDFFAWLRKLTVARMAMTDEDLLVSATCGAIEAARAGITCLGDSSSFATQAMKAIADVGLRAIVYQESFGPDPDLAKENVNKLREQVGSMRALETEQVKAGVSPHAPYTVSAPQLELISKLAADERLPLMMHAAESEAERLFMLEGKGPFAEGLRKRGIEWRAPGVSTIQYLERLGVMARRPLLAHCINVDDADIALMKERSAGISHCPKSNAKLWHGRAPFAKFIGGKLNVGLGSDSVASNNTCDILEEARVAVLFSRLPSPLGRGVGGEGFVTEPRTVVSGSGQAHEVSATDALFAATLGGARALGLEDEIGTLQPGMAADITIVDLNGAHQQPANAPEDALIFSSSGKDVILTMVGGKVIYRAAAVAAVDEAAAFARLGEIRRRIDAAWVRV
jgi:5-methylthioadenosine/S-adenosylhomocysteine deaminase